MRGVFDTHHSHRAGARSAAARELCRHHGRIKAAIFKACHDRFLGRNRDRGVRVLEVGCGTSSDWSKWNRVRVDSFWGHDISPAAITQCRKRHSPVSARGPHYTIADACSVRDGQRLLCESGGSFDVVSCTFALNHCFGDQRGDVAMDHICRMCTDDGEIILIFPARDAVLGALSKGAIKNDIFEMRRGANDDTVVFHQYGSTPCMVEPTLDTSRVRAELFVRGFGDLLVDAPLTTVARDLAVASGSSPVFPSGIYHVIVARKRLR